MQLTARFGGREAGIRRRFPWSDTLDFGSYFQPFLVLTLGSTILYQLALDATDDAVRFLHYWQVLERITSPQQMGRGIESNKIIERLSLLSTIPPLEKKVLKELGELRHNFAHVGEFPRDLGDHFVRMIKKFADRALYRLLINA